jgi:hypothetical protein
MQFGRLPVFATAHKKHNRAKPENPASNRRKNDKFHHILPFHSIQRLTE